MFCIGVSFHCSVHKVFAFRAAVFMSSRNASLASPVTGALRYDTKNYCNSFKLLISYIDIFIILWYFFD